MMRKKPDIIHGNWIVPTGLIAALAGFMTHTPVINTARGMDVRISEKGLVRFLFNLAIRLSNRLVVVSPAMKIRKGLEQAEVISSGVDDVFFTLIPERQLPTIISTRSLEPVYDIETLLRSLPTVIATYPNVKCILAGTGSQANDLKHLVRQLGIDKTVDFIGAVPQEEIIRLMQRSHIFVSTCADDGTSVAMLEAIASGLVPIAADIPTNHPWILSDHDGFLFKPGDVDDLAHRLIQALSGEIDNTVLELKRMNLKGEIATSALASKYESQYRACIKTPIDH